jgi:hypothetical protein
MNELASERATVAERHNYYKIFFLVERVRHIDHRRWLPVPSVEEALWYSAPVGEVQRCRERMRSTAQEGALVLVDLFGQQMWEEHIVSGMFRVPG